MSGRMGGVSYIPQSTPSLNTTLVMALRQQMDESNIELVHNLTQQMGVIFNPMVDQIGRMMEAFNVLLVQTRQRRISSNIMQVDPSEDELPLKNQERLARFRGIEPIPHEGEDFLSL